MADEWDPKEDPNWPCTCKHAYGTHRQAVGLPARYEEGPMIIAGECQICTCYEYDSSQRYKIRPEPLPSPPYPIEQRNHATEDQAQGPGDA